MPRYIDADALLEKAWDADTRIGYVQVVDVGDVIDAPTISLDEVRGAGKWLRKEKVRHNLDGDEDYRYECSACGHSDEHNENVHVPFCWHCGARMMEASEDA